MRQAYHFLKTFIFAILAQLVFVALFSVISFSFMYKTHSLKFPHIITIAFFLFIISTIASGVYACLHAKSLNVTHIRKDSKFFQFATIFAAIMMLVFFVCDATVTIVFSGLSAYFFFRVTKWILTLPLLAYFILQALPKRIGHTKIKIPSGAKIFTSICAIAWAVFGIFTIYFTSAPTTDFIKITQILTYASIAVFFVFEGEFENVKSNHKTYLISAIVCSTFTFAFPFGVSIAKIIGRFSSASYAPAQPELLVCVAIGLYAIAKVFAFISTMHVVIENSKTDFRHGKSHKKFDNSPKKEAVVEEKAPASAEEPVQAQESTSVNE